MWGKGAAIRPSQATNSRMHRKSPNPHHHGGLHALVGIRGFPRPSTLLVPRPWDGIGCTPLMSFPASEWGSFIVSTGPCLCKSQHFRLLAIEALRRNSTTILLRLFNPAMRLKCGSKLTRTCSTLAALEGASRQVAGKHAFTFRPRRPSCLKFRAIRGTPRL